MKKTKILSIILVIAALLTLLVSCSEGNVAKSGSAKIVIESSQADDRKYTVYDVDLSLLENRSEGVLSLLEYISSQKDSTLYYSATWGGGYGAYINSIGALNPDTTSGEYVAVYTSEECDFSVPTEYFPTVSTAVYQEKTLTFSGVGISSMTVNDGSVILFRIESYS